MTSHKIKELKFSALEVAIIYELAYIILIIINNIFLTGLPPDA